MELTDTEKARLEEFRRRHYPQKTSLFFSELVQRTNETTQKIQGV